MAKLLVAFFCALALTVTICQGVRYDGYRVYKVTFYTEDQFNMLYQMDIRSNKDIMFWQLSHAGHFADIMVAPHRVSDFEALMKANGFTYKVIIEDVQKNIDKGY